MLFYFNESEYPDFSCPHCHTGYEITEWNTEYGEVYEDTYVLECPNCGKIFSVEIWQETYYKATEL